MSDQLEEIRFWPFRFRAVPKAGLDLITGEIGNFGFFDQGIASRILTDSCSDEERAQLKNADILFDTSQSQRQALSYASAARKLRPKGRKLHYLIVIPTLRCDLSCSYCQVSRAPITASGYDWGDSELHEFRAFLRKYCDTSSLKIEFQGGEPTLRTDLISSIIQMAEEHCSNCEFVVCTNLTRLSDPFLELAGKKNLSISTSLDGPIEVMTKNRTESDSVSNDVAANMRKLVDKFGWSKLSALPTITNLAPENLRAVIDSYVEVGFSGIFLRPVNFHGFARKAFSGSIDPSEEWLAAYIKALEHIRSLNDGDGYFEEFYVSMLLRRIFLDREQGFVDIRSPALFTEGYCVVDYDGTLFPSDESRMLSRTRRVDLSVGSLREGFSESVVEFLNSNSAHWVNEECLHCAYLPFCGNDVIDDLSRYERMDSKKRETWFCRRHIAIFDFIFDKVARRDEEWLRVFRKWIYRMADPPSGNSVFRY